MTATSTGAFSGPLTGHPLRAGAVHSVLTTALPGRLCQPPFMRTRKQSPELKEIAPRSLRHMNEGFKPSKSGFHTLGHLIVYSSRTRPKSEFSTHLLCDLGQVLPSL